MSDQGIVLTGVCLYLALMIGVGVYASRRTHTLAEFIVAGRRLPPLVMTTSIVATWFGGGAVIGAAGASYEDGLLGVVADPFGAALCLLLVGLFFARLFRRLRLLTFVDFVEQRYGKAAVLVTAVASIFSNVGWVAGMLVAFGLLFESLTGIPLEVGILCGAVVVIVYTAVGGLWAVALTDFIQMLIIVAGLAILLVVVLIDVGGFQAIAARVPDETFRFLPREHTGEQWLNYLRMWVIFGVADIASQSLTQRALAARSETVAVRSFYFASVGYLLVGMIPVTLGIIASVTLPGLEDPEQAVPALALEHLHPVAIAIFVGAILAAVMSSADSALLGGASLLSHNLLPLVVPGIPERAQLLAARIAIPVLGVLAVGIALHAQIVYDVVIDANILLLAAVIVPVILGVWWPRANRAGAVSAMACGTAAWLVTRFVAPSLPGDLIGLIASLAAMLVVTPLTQAVDPPRPLRDSDGKPVAFDRRFGGWRATAGEGA